MPRLLLFFFCSLLPLAATDINPFALDALSNKITVVHRDYTIKRNIAIGTALLTVASLLTGTTLDNQWANVKARYDNLTTTAEATTTGQKMQQLSDTANVFYSCAEGGMIATGAIGALCLIDFLRLRSLEDRLKTSLAVSLLPGTGGTSIHLTCLARF